MKKAIKQQTTLRHKDFIFEASDIVPDRFDLYRATKSKNKKTGKITDSRKLVGYGYKFEEAIDKMIRASLGERPDIGDLRTYVAEYRSASLDIRNLLK
jgi:hypothetical protein